MEKNRIRKVTDQVLTANEARIRLEDEKVQVIRFINTENRQSVVHSHPYCELILNLSGSTVRYSSNGRLYDLHTGELIMIPEEIFHSATFTITMDYSERLVLQIDADVWKQVRKICHLKEKDWDQNVLILNTHAVVKWNLLGLFERMVLSSMLAEGARKNVLFCHLIELVSLMDQAVSEKATVEAVDRDLLVMKAVSYLQAHYQNPDLNASEVAAICYTSREHLSRMFRKFTLESIHGYLTSLRMQHFRQALAEGMSITGACAESGFSEYSSFLKTFRKLYGMTPSQYRKQLLESQKQHDPALKPGPKESMGIEK